MSIVLPLRLIWTQILVLLVSIAIEAWFFKEVCHYGKKLSVQYATIINLLVTCLGWSGFLYFFLGVNFSKLDSFKETIILLILFGKNQSPGFILFLALIIFVSAYFCKWQILQILEIIWRTNNQIIQAKDFKNWQQLLKQTAAYQILRQGSRQQMIVTEAQAVFIAHVCTNVAIVGILILLRRS